MSTTVSDVQCFKLVRGQLDLTFPCQAVASGGTIQIKKGNGVGTHIRWNANATDDAGNPATEACELVIVP